MDCWVKSVIIWSTTWSDFDQHCYITSLPMIPSLRYIPPVTESSRFADTSKCHQLSYVKDTEGIRMALSRAHTSARAKQPPLFTNKHTRRAKHAQCCVVWLGPHRTVTQSLSGMTWNDPNLILTLTQRDPDYHQNLMSSFVARVPHFHQILW